MSRKLVLASFTFAILIASLFFTMPYMARTFADQGSARALIAGRVDESKLVTLEGNTRPEAIAQNDRGIVRDDLELEHVYLLLRRPAEREIALEKYIDSLTDLHSPNYHQWLNPATLGEQYGLADSDISAITNWLASHGFTVNQVFPNKVLIDFSGNAGQVRQAFKTEMHNLNVAGESHIANMADPQIPEALAPAVIGVLSLNDFKPFPMHHMKTNYTIGGGLFAVVPADLDVIYNTGSLHTGGISGQGQTVVVIEDTDVYNPNDWNTFRSTFGLSTYTDGTFTQVHPTGTNACSDPGVNGAESEAILDAEYASAAAPSATIELASCSDTITTFGGLIAVENLVNQTTPPAIMSVSYGICEASSGATLNAGFNSAYQQGAAEGVSIFVAAGDQGASTCDRGVAKATHGIGITGWGETPYNVAVGGTDFSDTFSGTTSTYWKATNGPTFGSAASYIPETPWNDSCAGVLLSQFEGFTVPYGPSGFCHTTLAQLNFYTTVAGGGGPSGCATGKPSTAGVVSGTCAGYAKPSWQAGILGNPSDGVRDIPDVSLFAANGLWGHYYPFCDTDPADGGTCTGAPSGWLGAGGTSFASPIMAGIQALVNQNTGSIQGNPNPTLYSLAAAEYGSTGSTTCNSSLGNAVSTSCIFYDVTLGDMDVDCGGSRNCFLDGATTGVLSTSNTTYQPAFATGTGWDYATGIGTVNALNLVNGWPTGSSPSFSLNASPSSVTITQGSGGSTTINVVPANGFTGSVTLSNSALPSGVTAGFSPNPTTGASTLTMNASSTAATGTVTLTISGVSGALNASTSVTLTVNSANLPNFSLTATPNSLTVGVGGTGKSTIKVVPQNGFAGTVSFAASGLPAGVTATFIPKTSTTSSSLSLKVGTTASAGTSTITVTGTSGALVNSTTISLTISPSFTLTVSPATLTTTQGAAGVTSTLTIKPLGGFSGSVTLGAAGMQTGVTAVFSPNPATTTSTLTLTASATATTGTKTITITGKSGAITAKTRVTLTVNP